MISVLKVVFTAILLFSTQSFAKDLTNRLGIGYADQLSVDAPSLSARYYPSPEIGFSVDLGIQTGDDDSAFGLLVKVYRIIFPEDNLNFYMGGGAGLVSEKISTVDSGRNNSGFELMAVAGVEFFVPGIDSIGVSFEGGVAVTSIRSDTEFRTIGHSPLKAGMVFYF